jgi:hypothetical protein
MTNRALTLALQLLRTTAIAAAASSLEGCAFACLSYDPWSETETIELETDADLHAVVRLPERNEGNRIHTGLAVGAGGSVIAWGDDYDLTNYSHLPFVEHWQVGEADLHAAWADESTWWVLGDAGTVAVSHDLGLTWTPVDIGTTANLRGIAKVGSQLVVVGDGVVWVQGSAGNWTEALAPAGGWGELRAVHHDGSRVYAVGLSGKIWSAADPSGEWVAENIGTDVDLFDVGRFRPHYNEVLIAVVGAAGTLLLRDASGWDRVNTRTSVDLIAYDDGGVLAADGELFEISEKQRLRSVESLPGAQALSYVRGLGALAVGADGVAYDKRYAVCKGGRPFVVHDETITAQLRGADDLEPALARAWADDALAEHASVASFARFALELLALGAPPALLREVHVAIADELRHAKLCLGLARRFAGGSTIEIGALRLPARALGRVGDPVATALALFEEGCINESLAACEAADAAGCCEDDEVREVLESIAADERRHASLSFAALRWLLDTQGERVRGPLRTRLARVAPPRMGPARDCDAPEFGRLSPERRVHVHQRVFAELIVPLAHALLESTTNPVSEVA